jgi:hypothetical protein
MEACRVDGNRFGVGWGKGETGKRGTGETGNGENRRRNRFPFTPSPIPLFLCSPVYFLASKMRLKGVSVARRN